MKLSNKKLKYIIIAIIIITIIALITVYMVNVVIPMVFPSDYYNYSPPFGEDLNQISDLKSKLGNNYLYFNDDDNIERVFLIHKQKYKKKKELNIENYKGYFIEKNINKVEVELECLFNKTFATYNLNSIRTISYKNTDYNILNEGNEYYIHFNYNSNNYRLSGGIYQFDLNKGEIKIEEKEVIKVLELALKEIL